ncbi:hypothetical protein [Flavobacterium sp.]|uniref:hypothetical protein n=1 Tax=Flavobacterium sp. TaxID=239 RepID=UPI00404758D2
MRKFTLLLLVFTLASCKDDSEIDKPTPEHIQTEQSLSFKRKKYQNEAIILTDTIKIYDINKNIIYKITNAYGEIITIDSISEEKINLKQTNERCDLHNFIWVKNEKFSGWIYGEFVFEKENKNRAVNYTIDSTIFKFIPTKNFNIGVYDEEMGELSFCSDNQSPILFYNGRDQKYEYIKIIQDKEIYSENYLTLDTHDGWYDEIKSVIYSDGVLNLEIYREYQETNVTIEIEIYLDKNQSTAKVLKVTKGKEENTF